MKAFTWFTRPVLVLFSLCLPGTLSNQLERDSQTLMQWGKTLTDLARLLYHLSPQPTAKQ